MGIFERIFRVVPDDRRDQELLRIREAEIDLLHRERMELRESNGMMALRLEDYAWSPVAGWNQDQGFALHTLQNEADTCRAMYAVNPLMKKAVTTRTGLIHGRGNRILPKTDGVGASAIERILEENHRKVFGPVARARLEAELSTTGNVWMIRERNREAISVPIAQIAGYITDVDDPGKVLYWKRSYQSAVTHLDSGQQETNIVTEYIPAADNRNPVSMIGDIPVRRNARMIHIAANTQEGWIVGLPDLFAAKFWTRGHKEMFEAGHEYALAQGQFAAKVTGGSGLGSQLAASRLADEPRRDYETGEVAQYGGTFIGSNGMDLQLMGKMGSGIDFKSYDRIAGLIAAGTGVPLAVLLAESEKDEVSLESSVVEDMKLRQQLWGQFYEDFFGDLKIQVVWPRIKQETLYRVQQALEISNRTNTLTAEERRLVALESYGLEGNASDVPDISNHPDVLVYEAKKKLDLEYAALIAEAEASANTDELKRSTTNDQGNDQKLGKLSDGEDSHELRDAGEQEHTH